MYQHQCSLLPDFVVKLWKSFFWLIYSNESKYLSISLLSGTTNLYHRTLWLRPLRCFASLLTDSIHKQAHNVLVISVFQLWPPPSLSFHLYSIQICLSDCLVLNWRCIFTKFIKHLRNWSESTVILLSINPLLCSCCVFGYHIKMVYLLLELVGFHSPGEKVSPVPEGLDDLAASSFSFCTFSAFFFKKKKNTCKQRSIDVVMLQQLTTFQCCQTLHFSLLVVLYLLQLQFTLSSFNLLASMPFHRMQNTVPAPTLHPKPWLSPVQALFFSLLALILVSWVQLF